MPAALTEVCFICNPNEEALLKDDTFLATAAMGIAKGVASCLGVAWKDTAVRQSQENLTLIMGKAQAQVSQMVYYAMRVTGPPKLPFCSIEELAAIFLEEGEIEGVRGDVAWVQAVKETGYFRYGGIVLPEQNNYAGIGALNNNAQGDAATFESPRIGVRAQIQHLKAYASTEPLKLTCVDPRFNLVKRGTAKYVEWLGYKDNPNGAGWAWPGAGYGYNIAEHLNAMLQMPVAEEDDGVKYIRKLQELNLITGERDPDKQVSWKEFAKVISRMVELGK
jgi:hypothetical protein